MKKIKYRVTIDWTCTKKCTFGEKNPEGGIIRVGSFLCDNCKYQGTHDYKKHIIYCNHPESKDGN